MKHLRQIILLTIATVSLLLAILLITLWIAGRGQWLAGLNPQDPSRSHLIGLWYFHLYDSRGVGCIGFKIDHDFPTPQVGPQMKVNANGHLDYTPMVFRWYDKQNDKQPLSTHLHDYGFGYDHDTNYQWNSSRNMVLIGWSTSIGIPYWFVSVLWLIAVLTLAPTVAGHVREKIAKNRLAQGLCPCCGYDCRATPLRCPECGKAIETATSP